MKKSIQSLLILVIATVMLTGCSDVARKKLELSVSMTEKMMPIDLGAIGSITSMTYDKDDNNVTFNYELNDEIADIAGMKRAEDAQKKSMGVFLKSGGGRQMLEEMVKAEATLTIVFHGAQSGEEFTVHFTGAELKELLDEKIDDSDSAVARLRSMIEANNAQCPTDMGDGMTLNSVTLADGFMNYDYTVTGEGYDFTEEDMPGLKEALLGELQNTLAGVAGERVISVMTETGTGIRYIYRNADNGSEYIIEFTPDEVAQLGK